MNTEGMLEGGTKRWFVCGSLGGQRALIERINFNLLVTFRQIHIRDVNTDQACTRLFVVVRQDG